MTVPILFSLLGCIISFVRNGFERLYALDLLLHLKKKEEQNSFRIRNGIHKTANGLHDVTKNGITTMHQTIRTNLAALPPCHRRCQARCRTCLAWKREIVREFKSNFTSGDVTWGKADSQHWPTNMWEMAKVFSPTLMRSRKVINSVSDLDLTSLSNILLNCKQFAAINAKSIKDLKKIRNDLDAHNSTQKVTNADTCQAFKAMKNVLTDPVIKGTKSGKKAMEDINKLEKTNHIFCIICGIIMLLITAMSVIYLAPPWIWISAKVYFYDFLSPVNKDVSRRGCPLENKWIPYSSQEFKFQHAFERHKDFDGRDWLFSEINNILDNKKAVLLEGAMGMGKSAFAAAAICHYNEVAKQTFPNNLAYHKCQFDDSKTQDPVRFIRNIVDMIARRWPKYALFLYGDDLIKKVIRYEECIKDISGCFDQVILNPITQLGPISVGLHYTIIIDALDECSTDKFEGESITRLIEKKLDALPNWIKFIGTTRDSDCHEAGFYDWTKVYLKAEDERNVQDLQNFVQNIAAKLSQNVSAENSTFLLKMSRGHFLHLKEILKKENVLGIKADTTLEGIYLANFERIWGKKGEYFSTIKYCLEIMVASDIPVNDEKLYDYLQRSKQINMRYEEFKKYTQNLTLIITKDDNFNWRFNHQYITHWLSSDDRLGHVFHISVPNGHRMIAEYYIQQAEDQTGAVDIVVMAYHIHKANNKTLEKRFKELPSNYIKVTGGLFESGWSVRSPKVVELVQFHLNNGTRMEEAFFWSAIYGHGNTIAALVDQGGEDAAKLLFRNDYVIPYYKYGTLTELASKFNTKTAKTIQFIQNSVKYCQSEKLDSNNVSMMLSAILRSEFSGDDCGKRQINVGNYPKFLTPLKEINEVPNDFTNRKESSSSNSYRHNIIYDEYDFLCFAISTGNIDLARILIDKLEDGIEEKLFIPILTNKIYDYSKTDIASLRQQDKFIFHLAVLFGNTKLVSTLLDKETLDSFLTCSTDKNKTVSVVHIAVFVNHGIILKILLDKYPDIIEKRDKQLNMTALQIAVMMNNSDVLKILLKHKANINIKSEMNENVLHLAYKVGNPDMIKLILQKAPALAQKRNKYGQQPSQYALAGGHMDILRDKTLFQNSTNRNALMLAALSRCESAIDFVLHRNYSNPMWLGKKGADISVLHVAAINGDVWAIKKLLIYFPHILNLAIQSDKKMSHTGNYYTSLYSRDILTEVLKLSENVPLKERNKMLLRQKLIDYPEGNNLFLEICDLPTIISKIVYPISKIPTPSRHIASPILKLAKSFLDSFWNMLYKELLAIYVNKDDPWKLKDILHVIKTDIILTLRTFCSDHTLHCTKEVLTYSNNYAHFEELFQKSCKFIENEISSNIYVTALDIAIALNHTDASLVLIQAGAAMNLSNEKALGTYRLAMEQENFKIMEALKDNMIWTNTTVSSFMWDAKSHFHAAAYLGKTEVLKYFMSFLDLSALLHKNVLPHFAMFWWKPTVVETFGARMYNQSNPLVALPEETMNFFMHPKYHQRVPYLTLLDDIVESYLSSHEVKSMNEALLIATFGGHIETVAYLIDTGAEFVIICKGLQEDVCLNALDVAAVMNFADILKLLLVRFPVEKRVCAFALELAISFNNTETVAILVKQLSKGLTELSPETMIPAIHLNNLAIVKELFNEEWLSIETRFEDEGYWPLVIAVFYGNIDIIKVVEKTGLRYINYVEEIRLLHMATLSGKVETVKYLLEKYDYRNHQKYLNVTYLSGLNGHLAENYMLILNITFVPISNPLQIAAFYGYTDILTELMKYFPLDQDDQCDHIPLEVAIAKNHTETAIALIKAGSKIQVRTEMVKCVKKYMLKADIYTAIENSNLELVRYLLRLVPEMVVDENTRHIAAEYGNLAILQELSRYVSLDDGTTLCIAMSSGHMHIVEYLFTLGVLNTTCVPHPKVCSCSKGEKNLHRYKKLGDDFEALFQKYHVSHYNDRQFELVNEALFIALVNNRTKIVSKLIERGEIQTITAENGTSYLSLGIQIDDVFFVSKLLSHMPELANETIETKLTMAMLAAGFGSTRMLQVLSKYVNFDDGETLCMTLLHNQTENLEYLATLGVKNTSCQALTGNNISILEYVLFEDRNEIADILIRTFPHLTHNKPDLDVFYFNLLANAVWNNKTDSLTTLINANAMRQISVQNMTILLQAAISKSNTRIVSLIIPEMPKKAVAETIQSVSTPAIYNISSEMLKVFSNHISLDNGELLCVAVIGGRVEIVLFLLEYGVKNTKCNSVLGKQLPCKSVLDPALLQKKAQIIIMLLKHFPNLIYEGRNHSEAHTFLFSNFLASNLSSNTELVNTLVDIGVFAAISDEVATKLLFPVLETDNITFVSMFVKNKPSIIPYMKSKGLNPCLIAAGNKNMLKVLADYCDIEQAELFHLSTSFFIKENHKQSLKALPCNKKDSANAFDVDKDLYNTTDFFTNSFLYSDTAGKDKAEFYFTEFISSIKHNHTTVISKLISMKAIKKLSKNETALVLYAAVKFNNSRVIKHVLSKMPEIAFYGIYNQSSAPIFIAVGNASTEVLKLFSKYVSLKKEELLCMAMWGNNTNNVLYLLDYGAQNTSCHFLSKIEPTFKSVMDLALVAGNAQIIEKLSQLFPTLFDLSTTDESVINSFIANILSKDDDKSKLIEYFIKFRMLDKVEFDISAALLFMAVKDDYVKLASLIFTKPEVLTFWLKKDVNLCHVAAEEASQEMLKLCPLDVDDGIMLSAAIMGNKVNNVKYLLKNGVKKIWFCNHEVFCETVLYRAVHKQSVKITKLLVKHFIRYIDEFPKIKKNNAPVENTHTPLSLAVQLNHSEIVNVLLTAGANAIVPTVHGYNPLSDAIINKNYYIAAMLLFKFPELKLSKNIFGFIPRRFAQVSDSSLYSFLESEQSTNDVSFEKYLKPPSILHQGYKNYKGGFNSDIYKLLKYYVFASLLKF